MKDTKSRIIAALCIVFVSAGSVAATAVTPVRVTVNPVPVKVTVTPVVISQQGRQFVGVSAQEGTGGSGYAVLSRMCDAQYSGSRMCSIEEYLNSIHPAAHSQTHGLAFIRDDSSPAQGLSNCSGWTSDLPIATSGAPFATVVDGNGRFSNAICGVSRPVACCK